MRYTLATAALTGLSASTAIPQSNANCSDIHVFGARETTAPPGYGSSSTVVNLILGAYECATSEAIVYPAAGGNEYGYSVQQGVQAVTNAVTSYAKACPHSKLVLVGYSQGSQIMDDAMCGQGDPNQGITNTTAPISSKIGHHVKAMIWMGDPRHTPGAPYNVGNSTAPGFDPRPAGQICTQYQHIIQSYCDQADPYCSNGTDAAVHQGYGQEYGQAALKFVQSRLWA